MNSTISLMELLNKCKTFVIPEYQRGYIWGKSRESSKNSVEYILDSLLTSYKNEKVELFLQGLTVTEKDDSIVLIDGQQRTTFFYLLLKYLKYKGTFKLCYTIRKISDDFLNNDLNGNIDFEEIKEDPNDEYQDIFYFKKSLRIISEKLKNVDKEDFLDFVITKIKFLYINIPEEKAIEVFTMMNGSKAQMKPEEIIKAEILRLVSKSEAQNQAEEWEENSIRSKYAREWDKWLYWWNREEVKTFYQIKDIDKVMGLLISSFFNSKNNNSKLKFSFENFKHIIFDQEQNKTEKAKRVFYDLRHLQKKFEDVFYSVNDNLYYHNKIGAILCILDKSNREKFIDDYFSKNKLSNEEIDKYYNLVFLNLNHTDIVNEIFKGIKKSESSETDEGRIDIVESNKTALLEILNDDDLYLRSGDKKDNQKILADLLLLRLNIEEDTKLHRPFDFSIWENGKYSLEHIFPKSKSYFIDDKGKIYKENDRNTPVSEKNVSGLLNRNDFKGNGSVHCIGNLVLLYHDNNSEFGNKDFEDKKKIYFNYDFKTVKTFKSLSLLHTISIFSKSSWTVKDIQNNKTNIIKKARDYYGI